MKECFKLVLMLSLSLGSLNVFGKYDETNTLPINGQLTIFADFFDDEDYQNLDYLKDENFEEIVINTSSIQNTTEIFKNLPIHNNPREIVIYFRGEVGEKSFKQISNQFKRNEKWYMTKLTLIGNDRSYVYGHPILQKQILETYEYSY
ncbi:MAG: hypothetical protein AB8G05_24115 [Oligoflexales bacterium]